ncbi:hypothetical protein V8C86DRAFT_2687955 [Haematococcus lacustris]
MVAWKLLETTQAVEVTVGRSTWPTSICGNQRLLAAAADVGASRATLPRLSRRIEGSSHRQLRCFSTSLQAVAEGDQQPKTPADDDSGVSVTTFEEYKGLPKRRLCLVGNLGSRFETGQTVAGKTWAKASLAVHCMNQPGQNSAPKTEWYDLVIFDEAQARAAAAEFQKGEMVAVVGAFRPNVFNSRTYNKLFIEHLAHVDITLPPPEPGA